tara:strand:+ start:351 stop:746 length:396 start_codon:yes stop_codon:yes gene_type:complete
MSALSNYSENLILNWLMRGEGETSHPTSWHIALYTVAPNDAGGGTEVSGNGYSRQSVTWDQATGTGGTTDNAGAASFTASGGNFGTIVAIGIHDASSGGNLLWHGALSTNKTVNDGDTLEFAAGAIDLTIA